MIPQLQIEVLRLRTRLDLYVVLLGFTVLVFLRQALAVSAIGSIEMLPGSEVPPELLLDQARQLAGYTLPASIGTVLTDSFPFLAAISGFLACWTLGSEFTSGTVRTALATNPRRSAFFLAKLAGSFALAIAALMGTVIAGFAIPLVLPTLNVHLEHPPVAMSAGVVVFIGVAAMVTFLVVSLATLLTVLLRSAVVALIAFVATLLVASLSGSLGLAEPWAELLPFRASLTLLRATAPPGTLLSSSGGVNDTIDSNTVVIAIATLTVWTIGLAFAGFAVFRSRDVTE